MTLEVFIYITGIVVVAFTGVFIKWVWERVANSANMDALEKLEEKIAGSATKAEVAALDEKMQTWFNRFFETFTARFDKFEADIKTITKSGIDSGADARKEQWKEIRSLGERIAGLEGYLTTTNGYKRQKPDG